MRKLGRSNPDRMPFILAALARVTENGWILSVHSGVIKVLDERRQVGEIRDMGSGGYRLFFFWLDGRSARTLFVTALEKKSKLKGKARVNDFIDAADVLRRRYIEEMEEEE
jgi:hypothetical protein